MKKLSLLLIGFAIVFATGSLSAQTYTMTQSGDTVVNTATKACSLKVAHAYRQITIAALLTKISGTVAGTVTLQSSVDGTNFFTLDSAAIQTDGTINSPATYTATNVALQQKVWIINYNPYLWYKLSWTGSGTMSATLKGYLLPRE
jgi:hypothetical protein